MCSSHLARTAISVVILLTASVRAQSPQSAAKASPPSTVAQVMKGIVYPAANVFFVAQSEDPAAIKPDPKPSASPNLLTSTFGKWEAVENSALAMAESASLLTAAGRKCSNGADAPVQNADWGRFVVELREAGLTAYKAAQSKDQDKVLAAAEDVTTACSHCHARYRGRDRCK